MHTVNQVLKIAFVSVCPDLTNCAKLFNNKSILGVWYLIFMNEFVYFFGI